MSKKKQWLSEGGPAKELSQGVVLLALSGSSVGGLLGIVAIATRALGR